MILPEDDFPVHQSPVPLAQVMDGHPNAYDRYFFNAVSPDFYVGVALGLYPNRGVIDAAVAVARPGHQRSVFASDRLRGRPTQVGPIRVEIVTPMECNRIVVDAPEQGVTADLTYRRRSATIEEPRQTLRDGPKVMLDTTRATQLGTWEGTVDTPEGRVDLDGAVGTKDRSWGVRPVGEPLPGAPSESLPQVCFLWAPLHLSTGGVHYMSFDDAGGRAIARGAHWLDGDGLRDATGSLTAVMNPGMRRPASATLTVDDTAFDLDPVFTFYMRGLGYGHPQFAHGRWHGGPLVDGEVLAHDGLHEMEYANLHVEQVVRVRGGDATGLGVLESLVVGPAPHLGLTGLLDPG